MPAAVDIESRLEKSLLGHVGRAIADFGLIAEGDRVMVGVSGGRTRTPSSSCSASSSGARRSGSTSSR